MFSCSNVHGDDNDVLNNKSDEKASTGALVVVCVCGVRNLYLMLGRERWLALNVKCTL